MATVVNSTFGVVLGLWALRVGNKSSELAFKTQVNYHWQHARGRAMSVVSLFGNQLGSQVAVPLAANMLTDATDWRTTYKWVGMSVLVLGSVCFGLARERDLKVAGEAAPLRNSGADAVEPVRLSDDETDEMGALTSSADDTVAGAHLGEPSVSGWTRPLVLRCPAFWAHV
jgi:hypothetical protein